jgi:hypothetical protein
MLASTDPLPKRRRNRPTRLDLQWNRQCAILELGVDLFRILARAGRNFAAPANQRRPNNRTTEDLIVEHDTHRTLNVGGSELLQTTRRLTGEGERYGKLVRQTLTGDLRRLHGVQIQIFAVGNALVDRTLRHGRRYLLCAGHRGGGTQRNRIGAAGCAHNRTWRQKLPLGVDELQFTGAAQGFNRLFGVINTGYLNDDRSFPDS